MRGERQVLPTPQYGEIFLRRVSPSSPCRDLLPASGEKGAVIHLAPRARGEKGAVIHLERPLCV